MNFNRLIYKNIRYYFRAYKLVAAAALVMVAVLVGSLVTGDSVRATLIRRVAERLGDTETLVFSRNSFMEEALAEAPLFGGSGKGVLFSKGFISLDGKMIPVFVWGTDDPSLPAGTSKINRSLAAELRQDAAGERVVRLPAPGLTPAGSIFVSDNYTSSLRLSHNGIIEAAAGGNISLKNEQIIPFNIFVNRRELAATLGAEGKINLILSDKIHTDTDLAEAWDYTASGLSVHRREGFTEISSDRIFLPETVTETICRNNEEPNRLFSYLANALEHKEETVPYSFVTAIDRLGDEPVGEEEVILPDYTARRLKALPGDTVGIRFFISRDLKTLTTQTVRLRVKKIVPLAELLNDKTLSAEFPGLSGVERCTDWDSDLPIDMNLITAEDERYWELYRNTPKAIVAYGAVAGAWSNAYGNATAIRVRDAAPDLSELRPDMFGIQVIHPRQAGLYAAGNGVDFSGLFLALGFFILVSAVLLMIVPLSEMLYRRKEEIVLLRALGYTGKRIASLLWKESAPLVFLSSVVGVIAGLLYTALVMWLLGNVWRGATQTDGFSVYPSAVTALGGLAAGIVLSLCLLRWVIIRNLKERVGGGERHVRPLRTGKVAAVSVSVLAVMITALNFFYLRSVALFAGAGIVWLATAALWGDYLLLLKGAPDGKFHSGKLMWSALLGARKQVALSFFALSAGVFIVFSVGLNRKGFAGDAEISAGTGGFSLWCESAVPVYHNMTTREGREKLSLTDLPVDAVILQCMRFGADDASCLNLNKVTTPTVLGADMDALQVSDFRIERSLCSGNREQVFAAMKTKEGAVYPALVDATVLTWGLGMNLGDTLYYEGDSGQKATIRLAGTLSNSVFQGHILIDRLFFSEIWEETAGSEVFLLKTGENEKEEVKSLLSQALNEYGVRISTTNDRLRRFNAVTDTYLTIFLTLGGIGLLLGIMSFVIVIRKSLFTRHWEITLYRTLGFTESAIERALYRENLLVPLYAIAAGVFGSLMAVSGGFMNTGTGVWLLAFLFTAAFAGCVIVFVGKSVKREVRRNSPLPETGNNGQTI